MDYVRMISLITIFIQNLTFLQSIVFVPRTCIPQKTPLNGIKWCNFTNSASEVGSDCKFSCSKGFALLGPLKNKCVLDVDYGPVFEPIQYGTCEPIKKPISGDHEPYYIYARFDSTLQVLGFDNNTYGLTATDFKKVEEPVRFKVKTPGLSVGGETISLSLYDEPQKFLVFENNNLKLEDQPIDEAEKKDYQKWEEAATFSIISDLYFQGYSTLIPSARPHSSLMVNGTHVTLQNAKTEEERKRSSFFISKIRLNFNREEETDYDYSGDDDTDDDDIGDIKLSLSNAENINDDNQE